MLRKLLPGDAHMLDDVTNKCSHANGPPVFVFQTLLPLPVCEAFGGLHCTFDENGTNYIENADRRGESEEAIQHGPSSSMVKLHVFKYWGTTSRAAISETASEHCVRSPGYGVKHFPDGIVVAVADRVSENQRCYIYYDHIKHHRPEQRYHSSDHTLNHAKEVGENWRPQQTQNTSKFCKAYDTKHRSV